MIRKRAEIRGVVQGVGFRPFVYGLAVCAGVSGFVLNSGRGVTVEAEGNADMVDWFFERLRSEAPVLARIEAMDLVTIGLSAGGDGFEIRDSTTVADAFALVPPDIATCAECFADFRDPHNRRFGYPFTNCTNCGPRFTIIEDVPYDRPRTTMADFPMCPDCEREYHDPLDRRFHAQPNACPECGPHVALLRTVTASSPNAAKRSAHVRGLLREGADRRRQGPRRLPSGLRCAQRNRGPPPARAQAAQRQALRGDGAGPRGGGSASAK